MDILIGETESMRDRVEEFIRMMPLALVNIFRNVSCLVHQLGKA